MVNRQRVYPSIKDLPGHIRADFHNTFIHPIIQNAFDKEQPWLNPDLAGLQAAYNKVFPEYPARLCVNDAVVHLVRSLVTKLPDHH